MPYNRYTQTRKFPYCTCLNCSQRSPICKSKVRVSRNNIAYNVASKVAPKTIQTFVKTQEIVKVIVPAQKIEKELVPAQVIVKEVVPDQKIEKELVSAQEIVKEVVPAQKIEGELVPTQEIVKEIVSSQEIVKEIVPMEVAESSTPKVKNVGFLGWLCKLVSFPTTILKYLFKNDLRNSLPNKVVLITGASSGLGEALAHLFYIAGCKVILAARRTEELERVKNDLLKISSTSVTHPPMILSLDLTDVDSFAQKVKNVLDECGQIDILVNNGGISIRSVVVNTKIDVDMKVMQTNYFGAIGMTKAVLPSMIERRDGRILCIGSVQGKFAIPERASYSASKHALQAFCDSLRAEVHQHNVKVTLISPGYISTNFSINALTGSGAQYAKMDESTAKGTDPFEMAEKIVRAVLADKKDVMFCGVVPKLAYYIRYLMPSLYFWIMSLRAAKLTSQKQLKGK